MVSAAENELLTRVGRGTPMGNFMRQFWIPACRSSELNPDDTPMRLMLLGEKLIAFRDTSGRVGIFDHRCPHRCASLFMGRNEENGIRCVYHGWKFDVEGNCLDQPNLPEQKRFTDRVKAVAYKTIESGGLVFVYMGERAVPPLLPAFEEVLAAGDDRNIALTQRDCNWLQGLEGDLDTSHVGFLHLGCIDASRMDPNDPNMYSVLHKVCDIHACQRPFGTLYGASRPAMPGSELIRYASFVFPFWVTYPGGHQFEKNWSLNAWVPIDDEHTMIFNIDLERAVSGPKSLLYADGTAIPDTARPLEYLPRTNDWMGRWRAVHNRSDGHAIDRKKQRNRENFSGISGIPLQDQALQENMGPILDRTLEHPAASDHMVILTRRALAQAAKAYKSDGKLPTVLDEPSLCRGAHGGDVFAPAGKNWLETYDEEMAKLNQNTERVVAE